MATVYLGLGSNVEPEHNIRSALHQLRELFGSITVSPVYRGPAVGFEGADFYNLVVAVETELEAHAVNRAMHGIEERHGRQRGGPRFSDRTLDIDLLLYDDLIINDADLEIPRPEITRYAFVLRPLADIAPDVVHPTEGRTVAELWNGFPDEGADLTAVSLPGG